MRLPSLLATASALLLVAGAASASSHSEAPNTAKDRYADDTDTYAFVSPDAPGTVTLIGNWIPLQEPAGGPNFYGFDDAVHYYVNIDNDGDARADIRFRFAFTTTARNGNTFLYNTGPITALDDADWNVVQTYTVTRVDDGVPTVLGTDLLTVPANIGPKSTPDYATLAAQGVHSLPGGIRVFAGPRDDAFFVDLGGVFDLLTIRRLPGDKGKGVDGVGGYNVSTIAIQVPKELLTSNGAAPDTGHAVIGVWTTAERQENSVFQADGTIARSGAWRQVSRLGQPLVNEVVIARQDKDRFNAADPSGDGQFLGYVTNPEVPALLQLLYGIAVPPTPRLDLVEVFLTGLPGLNHTATPAEYLRLNLLVPPTASPNRLGVLAGDLAGFPNGRRLADDVTDIALRVMAGVLVPGFDVAPNNRLGDGVDVNDLPFLPVFPYLAIPHSGFEHEHHVRVNGGAASGSSPVGAIAAPAGKGLRFAGSNPGDRALLEYTLARPGRVSLVIHDVAGRIVRTLVDQDAAAGTFRAQWDGRTDDGVAAGRGVFFARLRTDGTVVDNRKLVLQ